MNKFFVYELVDPRDGAVFYVGSGTATRVRISGTISASIRSRLKYVRVKAIRDEGYIPVSRIVSSWANKADAFLAEDDHCRALQSRGVALVNRIRERSRSEVVPSLASWCGEASDYLVPCRCLPRFCTPAGR
jgi:hypothetical protein